MLVANAWEAMVPQKMPLADHLTSALPPLASAQVTELRAADARDVVATMLFLNDVAALKAPHPVHLTTELCNRIPGLCRTVLELFAAHASMPLGFATETESLLALWAAVRTLHRHLRGAQFIQHNQCSAVGLRAIHHIFGYLQKHRLLVLLSTGLRKHLCNSDVNGVARLNFVSATAERQHASVLKAHLHLRKDAASAIEVAAARKAHALPILAASSTHSSFCMSAGVVLAEDPV
mmetsp:Transcript_104681/g.305607  ORF Transcript_104681/g.305607 Transcript_104681/m.305607 type:complete len:235 (-) Transcript_104681:818-1522(-)